MFPWLVACMLGLRMVSINWNSGLRIGDSGLRTRTAGCQRGSKCRKVVITYRISICPNNSRHIQLIAIWNEYVTIAVNRNLSNCEIARKKVFRGFNGIRTRGLCVSAAVLYQPELWRPIHWEPANLLSSSTRERNETQNEMMWTAGIQMKWISDHRSESQFKQLRNIAIHCDGHIFISFVFPQFISFHSVIAIYSPKLRHLYPNRNK